MPDGLRVTAQGAVRVVTLDRPDQLNVVDAAMHRRLRDVWAEISDDDDARCVILTGAGKAFSGGGDFSFLKAQHRSLPLRHRISTEAVDILDALLGFRLPIVAAVNGPAVGLGASLVLCSDLVLMSTKSYLCDPHVSIGLPAGDGGALLWPYAMSMAQAKEFIFTGERLTAQRAAELGVANRVTEPDDLMAAASTLAERLAAQPSRALQITKRLFSKHFSTAAASMVDFGLSAETVELGAEEHIAKIREFIGDANTMESNDPVH